MRVAGEAIRFSVDPRDVPPTKAARRLHLALTEFERKKEELFSRGFPHPDPTTGMYDLKRIDAWMDGRTEADPSKPQDASDVLARRARRA